ncbi:MAG TPA: DHHA1 domain-containing protein, partial [Spirochaetia bacterium]|nr:DHHA1 domain-containing protein [Spirochaetia bacterium]
GEKLVKAEPSLVNVNISPRGSSTRVICFVGTKAKEAGVAADALVRELSKALGGSGGGTKDFAQGGGPKRTDSSAAKDMMTKSVSGMLGN